MNWSGNFREGLAREIRENKTLAKITAYTVPATKLQNKIPDSLHECDAYAYQYENSCFNNTYWFGSITKMYLNNILEGSDHGTYSIININVQTSSILLNKAMS